MTPLDLVCIGCGNIAQAYGATLAPHPNVRIAGATDIDPGRAETFVRKWGGRRYASLEAVLADPHVDLVLNLTTQDAHAAVTRAAIKARKHVYSEKPLALTETDAWELVRLAESCGVRLACAPMTFLGEAQQTAWRLLREDRIGTVKAAYAEANWGRLEDWHPDPVAFYDAGALFDVGPYAVTYLTTLLGPARSAIAMGRAVLPNRAKANGEVFTIASPDFVIGVIEFSGGVLARLTANFYVHKDNSKQRGIEFHGDRGSLYLGCWQAFDAPVEVADYGEDYRPVRLVQEPYVGTEWGRGVVELATAIEEGRPHRVTGGHAAHVTDILCALEQSMKTGQAVAITSVFEPPAPMPWALA